jgi:RNA polymerase sigma-70 factor (ECF subfamily)
VDRQSPESIVAIRAPADDATRWSLVAAARGPAATIALTELCARYWSAAYAFMRRHGHPPHVAQELTSGFFRRLVHEHLDKLDPQHCGRFREYLLKALQRAIVDAWRSLRHDPEAEGIRSPLPVEVLEDRFLAECADHETPEQAYEHSFAQTLVLRAFARLRDEAARAGRGALYAQVEPFLHREPAESDGSVLAAATGLGPFAAMLTLRSLRQRLRELVNAEIVQVVGDNQIDPELEHRTLRIVRPA